MMPDAIFVPVEDFDFAVDRTGRTAVTVCIESHSLDQVLMAMLDIQIEPGVFVGDRGYFMWKG